MERGRASVHVYINKLAWQVSPYLFPFVGRDTVKTPTLEDEDHC